VGTALGVAPEKAGPQRRQHGIAQTPQDAVVVQAFHRLEALVEPLGNPLGAFGTVLVRVEARL